MHKLIMLVITAGMALLSLWTPGSVEACVEGLAWGMPLEQVKTHLVVNQPVNQDQSGRFVARDVWLDRLPVSRATFAVDPDQGLTQLAYEFAIDDMTEVLAGLRARHGPPLSTSLEHNSHNEQIWVWNTGEDLITAVKQDSSGQQSFLISYRPSRLRPEVL
ncbi:MAG: hypothetical protein ACON4T_07650 [Synechococcus sp.]